MVQKFKYHVAKDERPVCFIFWGIKSATLKCKYQEFVEKLSECGIRVLRAVSASEAIFRARIFPILPHSPPLTNSKGFSETYSILGIHRPILVRRKRTTWILCPTLLRQMASDLFYAQSLRHSSIYHRLLLASLELRCSERSRISVKCCYHSNVKIPRPHLTSSHYVQYPLRLGRAQIKLLTANKGLDMYSHVYATGHIKDPVPLSEKRRGLSPGGRFPPSFIHQGIIITGLNKLYVLALKVASDADRA